MAVAFGGDAKERTPKQWQRLLATTAFELAEVHPTRSLVHFVEARPGRAASKWVRGEPPEIVDGAKPPAGGPIKTDGRAASKKVRGEPPVIVDGAKLPKGGPIKTEWRMHTFEKPRDAEAK